MAEEIPKKLPVPKRFLSRFFSFEGYDSHGNVRYLIVPHILEKQRDLNFQEYLKNKLQEKGYVFRKDHQIFESLHRHDSYNVEIEQVKSGTGSVDSIVVSPQWLSVSNKKSMHSTKEYRKFLTVFEEILKSI